MRSKRDESDKAPAERIPTDQNTSEQGAGPRCLATEGRAGHQQELVLLVAAWGFSLSVGAIFFFFFLPELHHCVVYKD